jgi:uncharacterized cupin superfamily protein
VFDKKSSPLSLRFKVEEAKKWATWEREESTFNWHYDAQETFYVIEGDVTVTWSGGEISFGTVDLVTFPAGLDCAWYVQKKIRKHYVFE